MLSYARTHPLIFSFFVIVVATHFIVTSHIYILIQLGTYRYDGSYKHQHFAEDAFDLWYCYFTLPVIIKKKINQKFKQWKKKYDV